MIKSILLLLLCSGFYALQAQTEIKLDDVARHAGDSVKLCGRIYGGKFLDQSKNKITLLNVGAAYPDNPLTLVISYELRSRYETAPEEIYSMKEVCITGKLVLYKGKPEIFIYKPEQIILKD